MANSKIKVDIKVNLERGTIDENYNSQFASGTIGKRLHQQKEWLLSHGVFL